MACAPAGGLACQGGDALWLTGMPDNAQRLRRYRGGMVAQGVTHVVIVAEEDESARARPRPCPMAGAGHLGGVSWQTFATGTPRFGNDTWHRLPAVSLDILWAELARWTWGFWRWVGLLFDTVLIAFVGTTLEGGVPACQLARYRLEFMRTVPEEACWPRLRLPIS